MKIDTDTIVTMTEANQNFSRVARKADQYGVAVIFKNNRPKYQLIDLDREPEPADRELTDDEKIDIIARQLLIEYRPAFLELAK
jgi:antitoxin Phd